MLLTLPSTDEEGAPWAGALPASAGGLAPEG